MALQPVSAVLKGTIYDPSPRNESSATHFVVMGHIYSTYFFTHTNYNVTAIITEGASFVDPTGVIP